MRGFIRVLAASAIAAACPYSASGQGTAERSGVALGPVQFTPRLVLQDLGIDSNVFNASTQSQPDFVFTFTPSVDVAARVRRTTIAVKSSTDFLYFARHASERGVNQRLAATAKVELRRVTLFGDAAYRNDRGRVGDEIDSRSRQREVSGEAGVRLAFSSRLSLQASRRETHFEFDEREVFDGTQLAEQLNHRETVSRASVRYAVTPLTGIIVAGETGHRTFTFSPARDAETWGTSVGVELHPRALITGQATIGYQVLEARTGAFPSFSGLVSSVNVSYRSPGSMTFGLGLDRLPTYSYFETEPYFVVTSYRASVRRSLSDRLELDASLRRAHHGYSHTLLVDEGPIVFPDVERVFEDNVGLTYRASRTTSVRGSVSYWRRRSDRLEYRNFEGVRSGLTFVFGL
jgi:hypothetical protein